MFFPALFAAKAACRPEKARRAVIRLGYGSQRRLSAAMPDDASLFRPTASGSCLKIKWDSNDLH
jgi:hypothetical protein